MSTKKKQAVIWFRFQYADTAAGRMQIQRAADKLFRLPCISERRTYTEEEVVGMVKEALKEARCRGQMRFSHADLEAIRQEGASIEVVASEGGVTPPRVTKKDADKAFYELMRKGGVSYIRAQKAYLGVRLFGSSAWEAGGKGQK